MKDTEAAGGVRVVRALAAIEAAMAEGDTTFARRLYKEVRESEAANAHLAATDDYSRRIAASIRSTGRAVYAPGHRGLRAVIDTLKAVYDILLPPHTIRLEISDPKDTRTQTRRSTHP